jgi:uncharacterized protein YlzI (FlbEa/FlbD family)
MRCAYEAILLLINGCSYAVVKEISEDQVTSIERLKHQVPEPLRLGTDFVSA